MERVILWDPQTMGITLQGLLKSDYKTCKKRTKEGDNKVSITYINESISCDTETTSLKIDGVKTALMYVWEVAIDDCLINGRTWESFVDFTNRLAEFYECDDRRRVVIYVHNLGFEFQFMKHYFNWAQVFSLATREPVRALTHNGIEFRDSLCLSGMSLKGTAKNLVYHKITKLIGDLDYTLYRHENTDISPKEWEYIHNDVRIVKMYIEECIDEAGDISKIVMTNTGRVRKFVRKKCLPASSRGVVNTTRNKYRYLMNRLTLEPDEYIMLKQAFQGGFTHANAKFVNQHLHNVASFDFTSSYPAVLLMEQFPMSKGEFITCNNYEEFIKNINLYCCVFDIKFFGLKKRPDTPDTIISISRCRSECKNSVEDNGRVVEIDECSMTITDVDFKLYEQYYTWDRFELGTVIRYKRGYLPTPFVDSVLELYEAKTTLKGVEGMEAEYLLKKGMLNSCYGMTVTDIAKDETIFDNICGWGSSKCNLDDTIQNYNEDMQRFLFYPWGVYCTAYARRNLFTGVTEFGDDYIYSDTDSVKVFNYEDHMNYINDYNDDVLFKLERAMKYHNFDINRCMPQTKDGKTKLIGVWDFEGVYDGFKTLGAKRYLTSGKHGYEITVAGVGKVAGSEYMKTIGTDDEIFDHFTDNLTFKSEDSGKMTHTYIDEARHGKITDYKGVTVDFETLSGVYLEPCEFHMGLSDKYKEYLKGLINYVNK